MNRMGLCAVMGLAIAGAAMGDGGHSAAPANAARILVDRWTTEKAWAWYNARPWLVGFNFVPSTACNTTEFWQAETFDPTTIDRELGWARELGFNTCRIFVQYLVWRHDPEGFKARFERFLRIACYHGISVVPVPFDDCVFGDPPVTEPYLGKQKEPDAGMLMPSWTPSPGLKGVTDRSAWPDLERYIKDFIGHFGHDRRVAFWDLYNEPGNSGMGDKSLGLVEAVFDWARDAAPEQPLTISVWNGSLPNLNRVMIEWSDIITYHAYTNLEGMRQAITGYKKHGRPVVCTEWMARLQGGKWETDLPLLKQERVGCYNWGLVNGRTQTQFAWGAKKGSQEPKVWFHDLFHKDGTAYDPAEIAAIQRIIGVPRLEPLFDYPVRDTVVCLVDGVYYLTGTTGHPTWWQTNEGIRIWKSADMKNWQPLGLVWTFEKDGTWQKKIVDGKRAIWAPELHHFNGTYWLAYCVNYGGTGVLKSTSGKAEGPYVDVKPDGPLTGEIDASLFRDDDGKVYFVHQNGKIARMKDDMSGLAEEPRLLKPANAKHVGFEGAFVFKANERYYLSCAEFAGGEYHCMVASSDNLYGPYGNRYLAVRHGGHNMFFKDKQGKWWSTFFGNDKYAPFRERPGIMRVEITREGNVLPVPP
jgi:xylan 1,4-beta-xylosidase